VPVFVQLGAWGWRYTPATEELSIRAQLVEKGGPAYCWDNIAASTLLYPKLLHSSPRHSHSILSAHRNTLIFQRKFFLPTVKTRQPVRQISSLLI
jgi:hypothetical protein